MSPKSGEPDNATGGATAAWGVLVTVWTGRFARRKAGFDVTKVEADADPLHLWLEAMPGRKALPFSTEPTELYQISALYRGFDPNDPTSLDRAFDTRVYRWTRKPGSTDPRTLDLAEMLATRLHDTRIDRLIATFVDAPHGRTVGFMGGHGVLRTDPAFVRVARVARALRRRDFKIATGGGPGLMEAANFGAFMAPYDETAFLTAIEDLKAAPDYRDNQTWVTAAARVRARLLGAWDAQAKAESSNLGVPTWVYGAEPPNLFTTLVGKYFYNSLREDGLVTIANGGLVFSKGDAGTVQEVFQNATLNYYRAPTTPPTPMVFYDVDFWNPAALIDRAASQPLDPKRKPVFPLIMKLGLEAPAPFADAILLTDDEEEIIRFILRSNPAPQPAKGRIADIRLAAGGSAS